MLSIHILGIKKSQTISRASERKINLCNLCTFLKQDLGSPRKKNKQSYTCYELLKHLFSNLT